MVTRDDDLYVLYPVYFDSKASRPLRRVARDVAVAGPTADQVAKACARLRLKPVLEKGRHHPARSHRSEGRVLVPVRGSKAVLVRQVAEELSKLRAELEAAGRTTRKGAEAPATKGKAKGAAKKRAKATGKQGRTKRS